MEKSSAEKPTLDCPSVQGSAISSQLKIFFIFKVGCGYAEPLGELESRKMPLHFPS